MRAWNCPLLDSSRQPSQLQGAAGCNIAPGRFAESTRTSGFSLNPRRATTTATASTREHAGPLTGSSTHGFPATSALRRRTCGERAADGLSAARGAHSGSSGGGGWAWLGRPGASLTVRDARGGAARVGARATGSSTCSSETSSTGAVGGINCAGAGSTAPAGTTSALVGAAGPSVAGPGSAAAGPEVEGSDASCSSLVEDTTVETWRTPLRRPGSVVALGKFDALHRGHRALAEAAAALAREIAAERAAAMWATSPAGSDGVGASTDAGEAVLLSFSGMAAVLGWPEKLPLTAPQDRGRVLAGWAQACAAAGSTQARASRNGTGEASGGNSTTCHGSVGGSASAAAEGSVSGDSASGRSEAPTPGGTPCPPRLRTMPFSLIRSMSPEQFVELLARDLGAAGVVAGRNYRFGYKAAGDADTLVRLGSQYGMRVTIVDLVQLPDKYRAAEFVQTPHGGASSSTASGSGTESSVPSSSGDGSPADSAVAPITHGGSVTRAAGSPSRAAVQSQHSVQGGSALCSGELGAVLRLHTSSGSSPSPGPSLATASFDGGASTDLDVEVELVARAGRPAGGGGSGSGGGGRGGPGGGGDSSTRVSSSRIRALLENGQVESVEQLLGRKYRLVCELQGASSPSYPAAPASFDSSKSGRGASSNTEEDAGQGVASSTARMLQVARSAYQNQPPANGQYRALARLVTGHEVMETEVGTNGAVQGPPNSDGAMPQGQFCAMVTLSDVGLELEMPEGVAEGTQCSTSLQYLLVDFDACGP